MQYIAVTDGTLEECTDVLRIKESGEIQQYYRNTQKWALAERGMSGIYCGEVEHKTITKEEAEEIIRRWVESADKSV